MAEENQEQQRQPIPEERVFATFKLYLDQDGDIAGDCDYNGTKLKALGVSPARAVLCAHAAEHVRSDIQETVDHVSRMGGAFNLLERIFERLGETDDSKDSNTTEGSGPDETAAGVSYGGEGGVELDVSRDS